MRRLICLSCKYSRAAGTPPTVTAVPHNCLTSLPGAGRTTNRGSKVLSVDGDFDAWLERPEVAPLIWDNAINVDSRHFLVRPHGEDERHEEDDTNHSDS